jgi:glutamate synthase domain-containing protein 2
LAGTAANTGEGGMLPEERKAAKLLIIQYSTSRFGITEDVLRQADGIEIKLGQGAKPGQGGLLPAAKVTPEIAKIRKVPMGQDIHSPPSHPDIKNWQDLRDKIKWLRQFTDGPIIVKIAAGDLEHDIPLIVKANPDVIAIDGMGGGSGAAPVSIMENFGMPTLIGLVRARAILDKLRAKQQLIIGGGLNTGADVAKALALGADAVFMAMAPLIAMGCIYCKLCYLGKCPVGIATQDPVLRKKLDPKAEQKVANFLNSITEEVKMIAAACGYDDVHKLNRNDLRCLDSEISKLTGIKTI